MAQQISLFDGTQPFKIDKPIRLIELFAGIGAQAKALENLGANFEHYRICEFDKYAVTSYNAIHGTNFHPSDITTLKGEDLGIVDTDKYCYVLTYSFPCQDLSPAGNGKGMTKGSGTRSGLLWEVERLLMETKNLPQVLVMENVPQVIGQKNMPDFAQWIAFLDGLGYKSKYALLNAKDYGIPQNRERCFMVSILGDYFYEFPAKMPLELRLKDMLDERVDQRYYLSDKMMKYAFTLFKEAKGIGYSDSVNNSFINPSIAHTIGVRSAIGQRSGTTNYVSDSKISVKVKDIKPFLIGGIGGKSSNKNTQYQMRKRVYGNEVACCCVATSAPRDVDKLGKIRSLTPKECWRLMGFTDADVGNAVAVGISNAQLYKQAGNSIVVQVLEAIFKQML